jgi:hypothetical protein
MAQTTTQSSNAPQSYIHMLERFFDSIDSGTLFENTDATYFRRLRDDIYEALYQLLF